MIVVIYILEVEMMIVSDFFGGKGKSLASIIEIIPSLIC